MGNMVLVLGYGNSMRSDDGLGWRAAQALRGYHPALQSVACQQLTPELACTLSQATLAIFIDAVPPQAGRTGRLDCQELAAASTLPHGPTTHHLTPAGLLACAQVLYGAAPRALLLSIVAATFDYGTALSPAVQAAMPRLLREVYHLAAPYLTQPRAEALLS